MQEDKRQKLELAKRLQERSRTQRRTIDDILNIFYRGEEEPKQS